MRLVKKSRMIVGIVYCRHAEMKTGEHTRPVTIRYSFNVVLNVLAYQIFLKYYILRIFIILT